VHDLRRDTLEEIAVATGFDAQNKFMHEELVEALEERGDPTTPSEWRDGGAKSRQSARRKRGSGPERQANRSGLKDAVLPD
jgi:hypothetical protein